MMVSDDDKLRVIPKEPYCVPGILLGNPFFTSTLCGRFFLYYFTEEKIEHVEVK